MYPAQALSRILAVQPVLDSMERDQAAQRSPFEHLALGQTLTGLVKSLTKGVALVEIDGQTVAMRLPNPPAPGEALRLRFAGHMPQPVFLLEMPDIPGNEGPQLSPTARMLSDLIQRLPERNALPTLTPPAPLLDQPVTQPAELALALRTALVRSGLFYESHLANWAVGMDTVDGLMQEPQNRLAAADAVRALDAERDTGGAATSTPAAASDIEPGRPQPLNPMHALLSQQLQVLESPQFVWQGEVWPGQMLEWQIRQETDAEHGHANAAESGDAAAAGWESRLKLTLPQLGTVNVHIKLDARQAFSIRMVPERAEVGPLLQKSQGQLVEHLATAGCTLQSLMVQADGRA